MDYGPLIRIALRYLSGMLVSLGIMSKATGAELLADPDLILLLSALLSGFVEWRYMRAKSTGRPT